MIHSFFSLEVKKYNYSSNWTIRDAVVDKLENFSNVCFAPTRYLFGGETLHLEQYNPEKRSYFHFKEKSFQGAEKTWLNTPLAVSLFIPGLILGTVSRSLTRFCPGLNGNQSILNHLQESKPKTPKFLSEAESLTESHKKMDDKASKLLMKMSKREIWQDPSFIIDVNMFMKDAYKEVKIYYSQLSMEANGDPKRMAELMVDQGHYYCRSYFRSSVIEMYHLARGCVHYAKRGEDEIARYLPLSYENQKPYFTPGTLQWEWRMLYNKVCKKIDDYGLRIYLDLPKEDGGDERFGSSAVPDFAFVPSAYIVSISPT